MLSIIDSKPGKPLLLHDEPIYLKDKIIGRTTSEIILLIIKKICLLGM